MARFFIHRPIFAIVIALIIVILGVVSGLSLPIAQYPQISQPTINVSTTYTGANADVINQTVAQVIEQQVNGTQGMDYMSSTSDDSEKLLFRPKETEDGALPCGNSAAGVLFHRLFALAGEESWRALAEHQADFLAASAGAYPAGRCFGMLPLLWRGHGTKEIVCVLPDGRLPASFETVRTRWAPETSLLLKTPANAAALAAVAPFTAPMEAKDGKSTWYVCEGGVCGLPVTEGGEA